MNLLDTIDWTLELLHKRQQVSPKRLTAPGPSPSQIRQLFDAAAQAPDHGLILPWRFVQFSDAARADLGEAFAAALVERDAAASAEQLRDAREKAQRAPFVAVAIVRTHDEHPEIPLAERIVSLGCALQNILLAACAQGFGAGLVSGQAMDSQALRCLLGLRHGEQAICFITVGTVKASKAVRARPDPDAFVTVL